MDLSSAHLSTLSLVRHTYYNPSCGKLRRSSPSTWSLRS